MYLMIYLPFSIMAAVAFVHQAYISMAAVLLFGSVAVFIISNWEHPKVKEFVDTYF